MRTGVRFLAVLLGLTWAGAATSLERIERELERRLFREPGRVLQAVFMTGAGLRKEPGQERGVYVVAGSGGRFTAVAVEHVASFVRPAFALAAQGDLSDETLAAIPDEVRRWEAPIRPETVAELLSVWRTVLRDHGAGFDSCLDADRVYKLADPTPGTTIPPRVLSCPSGPAEELVQVAHGLEQLARVPPENRTVAEAMLLEDIRELAKQLPERAAVTRTPAARPR